MRRGRGTYLEELIQLLDLLGKDRVEGVLALFHDAFVNGFDFLLELLLHGLSLLLSLLLVLLVLLHDLLCLLFFLFHVLQIFRVFPLGFHVLRGFRVPALCSSLAVHSAMLWRIVIITR